MQHQTPLFNATVDISFISIIRNKKLLINSTFHIIYYCNRLLEYSRYHLKSANAPFIIVELDVIQDTGEILQIRFGNTTILADELLLGTATFTQLREENV